MILDNSKSAKDYISEAYAVELALIQANKKLMETPASIIEKEKIENTLKSADEIIAMDILSSEITNEYNDLQTKIKEKKAEIFKLYGIEVTEDSLDAIRKAFAVTNENFSEFIKNNDDEFKASMAEEFEKSNAEIDCLVRETDEKINSINAEIAEKKSADKKSSQREIEEYRYNLNRKRKQEAEARAKLVDERQKALDAKGEEISAKCQKIKDELSAIDELQKKVDDIESQLEEARQRGADAKSRELGREYGYKSAMAKQESTFRISKLQKEFDRLEAKYKAVIEENALLSAKLDKCNAESRQLATDTVKSTGGINILNTENGQNSKK